MSCVRVCLVNLFRAVGSAAILLVLVPGAVARGETSSQDGKADEETSVQNLLNDNKRGPDEGRTGVYSALFPIAGLSMACTLAAGGVFLVYRRRRWQRVGEGGGNGLRVLERVALSPKHWMCLVRAEGKYLVVGMTPESISTLAVIDEEAPLPQSLEPVQTPTIPKLLKEEGASSYWFRPQEEAPKERKGSTAFDDDLAPYRREVTRLKAMLQNWRQTPPDDRAEGRTK